MDFNSKHTGIIKKINQTLIVPTQYDGFWIDSFKRKTLVIYSSHDRIYGADYELVFKNVIFYNIPYQWRDTNVDTDALLRLATPDEFAKHHPGFDAGAHMILALDLHLETNLDYFIEINGEQQRQINRTWDPYTFFIVAKHVYLSDRDDKYGSSPTYEDQMMDDEYPAFCRKNRVVKK